MFRNNYKLTSGNYLLSNDILHKYHIKSCYKKPKIVKFSFKILIEEIISSSMFSNSNDKENFLKIKTLMLLYLLFSFFPLITAQKIKSLKKKNTYLLDDEEYFFDIIVSDKTSLNELLSKNFLGYKFSSENLNKRELKSLGVDSKKEINFNTRIPVSQFFDVNEFFSGNKGNLNLTKIFLHTNITYSNIPSGVKPNNLFKLLNT